MLFRLFTNLKIHAVILFNFKRQLNLFISTMCSNLQSAGFSFGTLSINNVHIFNSLKKFCSLLLKYSMKRGMFFSSKKLGTSHQNLFSRNVSNLFKRVKISAGLCSVAQITVFTDFLHPVFNKSFKFVPL